MSLAAKKRVRAELARRVSSAGSVPPTSALLPAGLLLVTMLGSCGGETQIFLGGDEETALPATQDSSPGDSQPDSEDSEPSSPADSEAAEDELCPLRLVWGGEAPYLTEGDRLQLQLRCPDGELDRELTLVNPPTGSSWDPSAGTLDWLTDLGDGGRYDLQFTWGGGSEALPESMTAPFWVADDIDAPDNLLPLPQEYTEEWGLPVIHVQASASLTDEYTAASCTFYGETIPCDAKYRGAASLGYDKKSFTLRFPEEHLDAEAQGMPNKDHLVLVTTMDDNSYVRQKLCYDMWMEMASFWGKQRLTPRTFFLVLYLNGSYHGLYTGLDHVDNQFMDQMGFNRDGNLYKAVNHDANFYWTGSGGGSKSSYADGYEKKEGEPESGAGAYDDLIELVGFTGQADHQAFLDGADAWLPLDEFMDWFLFVHFLSAGDSAGKNSYIYNDPNDREFRFTPWDFNHALGQTWQTIRVSSTIYEDFRGHNAIFNHVQANATANAELWSRWEQMGEPGGPLSNTWIEAQLDDYYAQIDRSAARDWSRWRDAYRNYWSGVRGSCGDCEEYEGERQYLYDWLRERDAWRISDH